MKSLEADVEDVNTAVVCHSESVDERTAEMQSYKNLFQDISIMFKACSNFLIKLSISMSTDSEVSLFGRSMQRSISALLRGPVFVVPGKNPSNVIKPPCAGKAPERTWKQMWLLCKLCAPVIVQGPVPQI